MLLVGATPRTDHPPDSDVPYAGSWAVYAAPIAATELLTTATQDLIRWTQVPARRRGWRGLPWRCVLLPWAMSRVVAAIGLVVLGARPLGSVDLDALADWDVGWFQSIMAVGYGPTDLPAVWVNGAWTSWPFFPLHPFLAQGVSALGVSDRVALILVNNAAYLVALWGVHRLACRHVDERTAGAAVWAMALFPGSVTSVMGYSGGLFVAGTAWAFVLIEKRRPVAAGLAVALAASSRPNGFLALVALVPLAVVLARGRRDSWARPVLALTVPTVAFMGTWSCWCWHATGDAVVYLSAKAAWEEVSLLRFVESPWDGGPAPHVFLGAIAVSVLVVQARRLPRLWHLFVAVMIAPALVLGVTGLGRYAAETFPIFVAVAGLLDRLPRWMRMAYFATSATGLALCGMMVNRWRLVP